MKRLTHMGEHGPYWDKAVFDPFAGMEEDIIIERLAAYEETGLSPEEISDAVGWMSPVCIGCDGKTREGGRTDKCGYLTGNVHKCMKQSKHLADLARAEQEGRLVILDEPRLPLIWGDEDHDTILCPNCKRDLMGGFELADADGPEMVQCPHCGQPVDVMKALEGGNDHA